MNILLDMDGVLANFVRGCCRACGRDDSKIIETWPPEEWNLDVVLKMPIEELWKYVNGGNRILVFPFHTASPFSDIVDESNLRCAVAHHID